MDEKFRKAEEEYFILRGKFDTGRIGKNLFELALKDMAVQDSKGRWWMIGADTGNWYVHDGKSWLAADPSREQVMQTPTTPVPPSTPGSPSSSKSSNLPLIAGIGCVAIICVGAAAFGAYALLNLNLRPGTSANALTLAAASSPVVFTTPTLPSLPTAPVSTFVPTETSILPTDTPFRTRIPSATLTSTFPPGVYVVSIRTDPSPPKRRDEVVFYPLMLNTTGAVASYRIVVYIYRPDQINRMGESFSNLVSLPLGQSEQVAPGWRLSGPGGCEDLIVRVGWVDDLKRFTQFNRTTGQGYEQPISVCP
jgi:hypothetical protein